MGTDDDKLLDYKIDRVLHKVKGIETAIQFVAEKGAKHNEQLLVHDQQFREFDRRFDATDETLEKLMGLLEEVKRDQAVQRTKLGFYAAVGSLVGGGVVSFLGYIATQAVG